MEYHIYSIRYGTSGITFPMAIVSASSEDNAKSLLETKLLETLSISKELLNFEAIEIKNTGYKSDKEGVLHTHVNDAH